MPQTIAVIGAGELGATLARRLAASEACRRVLLLDPDVGKAKGKALDILQSGPVEGFDTRVEGGPLDALSEADVVVLADPPALEPGRLPSEAGELLALVRAHLGRALLIVAGGVVTGILAGLFGIGGGGIIVPILYEVFGALEVPMDVRLQLCVGTSIAIILPTTIRSYRTHLAKGAVLPGVMRLWAVPAVLGVGLGSLIAMFAPGPVFKIVFVVVASIIAFKMLFGRDTWRVADEFPGPAAMKGYGFFIGITSSLMGVSGGSISNMVQTLYGIPLHNAVATSSGLGVPITEQSLGLLIANGYQYMLSGKYWISFYPGIALLVTIMSINLVGDQLRDVLNPRLRR